MRQLGQLYTWDGTFVLKAPFGRLGSWRVYIIESAVYRFDDLMRGGKQGGFLGMFVFSGCHSKCTKTITTRKTRLDRIPLLVDLGRRLDLFKRETFCPHVWCRQQRCHHRHSQRSNRRHDPISLVTSLTCEMRYIPYTLKTFKHVRCTDVGIKWRYPILPACMSSCVCRAQK